MKRRATRQLAVTYDVLAAAADHPTARQVFDLVRKSLPRVSLGTVYRNLCKLHEQGRLQVLQLGGGVAHYDALVRPHDHFVCEDCGAVTDLEHRTARPTNELAKDGFLVHWQTTVVHGRCRHCSAATIVSRRRPSVMRAVALSER
jgi:Fe2+ or Zn2+ uptake regulation protein